MYLFSCVHFLCFVNLIVDHINLEATFIVTISSFFASNLRFWFLNIESIVSTCHVRSWSFGRRDKVCSCLIYKFPVPYICSILKHGAVKRTQWNDLQFLRTHYSQMLKSEIGKDFNYADRWLNCFVSTNLVMYYYYKSIINAHEKTSSFDEGNFSILHAKRLDNGINWTCWQNVCR